MRALITGGSGFIGGALAANLMRDKWEVYSLDRDRPTRTKVTRTFQGHLESMEDCSRIVATVDPDAVFHLGAQAMVEVAARDPWGTLESNVRGTYNLLEACRRQERFDRVIVVASSDKAYGESKGHPYREDDPLDARGPYDVSKMATDAIARSYGERYAMRVGIIRAGNVYGEGDEDLSRIVPSVCHALRDGRRPEILSDGTPVRDYVHVSDVVSAYRASYEYQACLDVGYTDPQRFGRAHNVAGGEPISVLDLVRKMGKIATEIGISGDFEPTVLGDRVWEIKNQVLDTTRAKAELRWSPKVSLGRGLKDTVHYWWTRDRSWGWWIDRANGRHY